MKSFAIAAAFLALIVTPSFTQQGAVDRAAELEQSGKFREAAGVLRDAIERSAEKERMVLAFELDRLRRIRLDYSLTSGELWQQLQRRVRTITAEEFEGWQRAGWFDGRMIDDTLRFVGVSTANLFLRHPELESRRVPSRSDASVQQRTLRTADSIRQAVARKSGPFVLPKKFRMRMAVAVDADAVPDGAVIRAWLPVPVTFAYQHDLTIVKSSSPVLRLAPDSASARSAYMEQRASKGRKTLFRLEYRYTTCGVRFPLDSAKILPVPRNDPRVRPYLQEGPHVVFTERMRALSDTIVGGETNPMLKAKKIHDWISENILYSYAREYSTIRNISDYCLTKRYGDCGQHALLFITLCRLNGIPARWQSGWYTLPGAKDIHDWTEIYLVPYGWVPVDPDMGIFAMRYYTSLPPEDRRRLRDFYFGGLDQYRMAANSDHCQPLDPPKRTLRSDTVDFQRGEVEWEGGNIYFDRYSYSLNVEEVRYP